MTINETAKTSTYLFSDLADSKIRFGLQDNGTEYSKISQPAQDIFKRRIARLYNSKIAYSNKAENVIDALLMAVASGNEKIAVLSSIFAPIKKLINTSAENHCIRITYFDDISQLEKLLKNGAKAVVLSSASVLNCTVNATQASRLCSEYHTPLIVDNTLATAYNYNPFSANADIVIEMSQLVTVSDEKNSYVTLLEKQGFNWLYNNRYSKLYPYRNISTPVTAFVRGKCKTLATEDNKEAQAEYFTMCEGLRTLCKRFNIHSANIRLILQLLQPYCNEQSYNFINNKASIYATVKLRKEFVEAVKEKLLPVTIYKQERLYTMYSCTAVFFEDDTMYIKAGTEPAGYLKQMFSIM